MLATNRNKKLGRITQKEIEELQKRKNLEEHLNRVVETNSTVNIESRKKVEDDLTKEQFEQLVHDRASAFCNRYNISGYKTIYKFAYSKMDNNSISYKWEDEVMEKPYKLMKMEGVGCTRADSVAMKLNFPIDHKYRILAYVGTALEDLSKGSTILGLGETLEYMANKLNINNNNRIIDVVLNQSDNKL